MVELKLFHKILIFIAVVISIIKLTSMCAPKSVRSKPDYSNMDYIPPVASRSRPVERVTTPRHTAPERVFVAQSTAKPYTEPESDSGIFYVRGLD